MKIYWKKHAQRYLALTNSSNSLYHPARAQRYFESHMADIEYVLGWWKRTHDEHLRRMVVKIWRKHLTTEKS